ncbi:hypothetical protein QYE76_071864 [Lolium multiflorum]|uniref:MADS-box domain-containing protein n=1 Tax=Lolium multiflorum TaxID=4521 RepID=A0AAD8SLP3_LOLMU|nr:hypothetical protein QYE76_071864 [Lolium multiflorum]
MQNGRLKIQWIKDSRKRKAALKKRLPSLLKKTRELATLCDVPVCLIVYRPGEDRPVVCASPDEAASVLRQYRDVPMRYRNVLDSVDFLKQMIAKTRAELSIVQRQRRDLESKIVIIDFIAGRRKSFDDLPTDMIASVGSMVWNKLEAVNARLQELRSVAKPAPEDVPMVDNLVTGSSSNCGKALSAAGRQDDDGTSKPQNGCPSPKSASLGSDTPILPTK